MENVLKGCNKRVLRETYMTTNYELMFSCISRFYTVLYIIMQLQDRFKPFTVVQILLVCKNVKFLKLFHDE